MKLYGFILSILGTILFIPALILSLILPQPKVDNKPWNKGMVGNLIRAYKRYNTQSWIRRIKTIWKRPIVVVQYIKILLNKKDVVFIGNIPMEVSRLIPQHLVETTHAHHRKRVEDIRVGKEITSPSPVIVVNGVIHDGHHRVAAYKEAGVKVIDVMYYIER